MRPATVVLFAVAGFAHGYAFGESIVGAEATPLAGYFVGLIIIQIAVAGGAYSVGRWCARHRPGLPLLRAAGAAAAIAGVTVITLAVGGLLPRHCVSAGHHLCSART